LGRGITALIPADLISVDGGGEFRELPIASIEPNRFQPRTIFEEETLLALSESIRELGVLQPVLVRPLDNDRFELIAGERRWRAARRAGLGTIPAIVRPIDDTLSLEQALVENLHREDLNPLEEAAAYQQLVEDFGLTQEEVASRVGKSRSAVANHLRLFQLPPAIQRLVGERRISAGHARALLGTPDRAFQEALANRIASEGLSVRDTEEAVRRRLELESRLMGAVESPSDDGQPSATSPSKAPSTEVPPAGLLELERLLGEYLDTRVSVQRTRARGRITIDFADLEDLERIYRLMAGAAINSID
jgi:ParB family chromosome partitioning protein